MHKSSRPDERRYDSAIVGMWTGYLRVGRTMTFLAALEEKLTALTAEAVTAAWRRHLDPAQISIVKAGDFKKASATK